MAHWRKTNGPGSTSLISSDARRDNDDGRCRCEPSWRGRRRHPVTGRAELQKPVTKDRNEVLAWLGVGKKAAGHVRERARSKRAFESIGDEWLEGVRAGRIGRRKGRSKPYSPTTIADYTSAYRNFLRRECGPMPADEIGELAFSTVSRSGVNNVAAHGPRSPAPAMTPRATPTSAPVP